jgi:hypothetical protein
MKVPAAVMAIFARLRRQDWLELQVPTMGDFMQAQTPQPTGCPDGHPDHSWQIAVAG